jgi:hypothetical protein
MGEGIEHGCAPEPPGTSPRIDMPCDKRRMAARLEQFLEPFLKRPEMLQTGHYALSGGGSVYAPEIRNLETFLRLLWGVAPLSCAAPDDARLNVFVEGVVAGTNPDSPHYWGDIGPFDQRMVEMAALATALLLHPERFWDTLTSQQQHHLATWLGQINDHEMPATNWLFFRVLVNVALKQRGCAWSPQHLEEALDALEQWYLGNGWYCDGFVDQIDYYVPMAFHYYSLIYAKFMAFDDPLRAQRFCSRAREFAANYVYWFASTGASIPFGRSLTYRFAHGAFFSALVFADVEALPWGQIKQLLFRHLEYWDDTNMVGEGGYLTVGYKYPNGVMAEGYNAAGSPYWAFKTYLLLAVNDAHPFWQVEPQPVDCAPRQLQREARMLVCRSPEGDEVQAFTAGQHSSQHAHADAKYEKFVYSTTFGFSVPKGCLALRQGAFDNCLAVAESGRADPRYESAYGLSDYAVTERFVRRTWQPWPDVTITTWVVPLLPWHIRVHRVVSGRDLLLADGGFALPKFEYTVHRLERGELGVHGPLASGVVDYGGNATCTWVEAEPNTHLLFPATVIPTLTQEFSAGEGTLIHGFFGEQAVDPALLWDRMLPFVPEVRLVGDVLHVRSLSGEWAVKFVETLT